MNLLNLSKKHTILDKKVRKKITIHAIMSLISSLIVGLGLLWQWSTTLIAWCNAFWFAFSIYLLVVWTIFIYNQNVLSSFIHSVKTFGLMFVGKKPKLKYSEYKLQVEENKIPTRYGRIIFTYGIIMLIISIVLIVYIEVK